jgi:hypothetical protein
MIPMNESVLTPVIFNTEPLTIDKRLKPCEQGHVALS